NANVTAGWTERFANSIKGRRHLAAPLVLASHSPRRRSLLRRAGFTLEVVVAQVDELATPHLSLRELTIANASRKARVIAHERMDNGGARSRHPGGAGRGDYWKAASFGGGA